VQRRRRRRRRQLDDDDDDDDDELLLGRHANDIIQQRRRKFDDELLLGRAFAGKLLELEAYRNEYGDCLVPKRYKRNPSLGNWVNKQRQNYRKFMRGEKSSMNEVCVCVCVCVVVVVVACCTL
jgi:hypothetical protein